MSGLRDSVTLEAKNGRIIISNPSNPREGWDTSIKSMVEKYGDPTEEFQDENNDLADEGLDKLPWEGISYEDWFKKNDRLS